MELRHVLSAFVLLLAACAAPLDIGLVGSGATLRFVNAVHGNVNLMVDGQALLTNVPLGGSRQTPVGPGAHSIVVEKVGGAAGGARSTTIATGGSALIVALDSAGTASASVLSDTGAVVPAGATKLRVAHYATLAPQIDIWRTQPDFGTPIRVMFPFNAGNVSPYLQSTVGDWHVMVSHAISGCCGSMPDTLANTGLFAVADGKSKTVIVTDGGVAGSVQVVVVEP
jgi:hypothetical protein